MTLPLNLDQIDEIYKMAIASIEQFKKEISGRPEIAPGSHRATDEELIALANAMIQRYPPQELIRPDGTRLFISPWIAQLQLPSMDGATDDMRRLIKLVNFQTNGVQ